MTGCGVPPCSTCLLLLSSVPYDPKGTVCKKCGLWYLFPMGLDRERNICPRCGAKNGGEG